MKRGRGILVVKVTNSWLVCHEVELSTAEVQPSRGSRCTLNTSRLNRLPIGVDPRWALSRSRSTGGPPRHFGVTVFTKT
ncbi:hypothetical protein TNCV_2824081 [Trichonephila clavipes]|nr:hypothetical protein TNCV_2824081 [Trichonephila clavipes]